MNGNTGKITINKLLLIIGGECFRDGGQRSRLKDTDISIENQLKATNSHIDFINYLYNTYGITTDIQLISYDSKYENILINKYKDYNLNYKFYNYYFRDRTQLVNSIKLKNIEEQYDGILVIRPDMYLKKFFFEIFDPYSDKICYPSVCFIGQHRVDGYPRINDTMVFVPKKFLQIVYYTVGIKLYHEAIKDYITSHNLNLNNDFDFFLKTLHDSDSYKDYNPIYYFVSRKASTKWHSYGYTIEDTNFLPIETSHQLYDFPDWELLDNISYKSKCQIKNSNNIFEWWDTNTIGIPKFIDVLEINTDTQTVEYNSISPERHYHESFYSIENNYKLSFYDHNKNLTSILYRYDNNEFRGKSLLDNNIFILKKNNNQQILKKINKTLDHINRPLRVALCLRGAVSRKNSSSHLKNNIYDLQNGYIDYTSVFRSIQEHIYKTNQNSTIDTFIHCWNEDLESELNQLYCPVKYLYENNNNYITDIESRCKNPIEFAGLSHALSIKKVLEIKEEYEKTNNFIYDIVILYRPDVLIWKNIEFKYYLEKIQDTIYVNAHPGNNGDFHFIMSSEISLKFKNLYDSSSIGNNHLQHFWIQNFITNYIKCNICMDNIVPGRDQEVARPEKIIRHSINENNIDINIFKKYGITKEYLFD